MRDLQLGHILVAGSITLVSINFVNLFSENIFLQTAGLLAAAVCLYYLTLDYKAKEANKALYAAYIGLLNFIWCAHLVYVVLGIFVN